MRRFTAATFAVLLSIAQPAKAGYTPPSDFRGISWGADIGSFKDSMEQTEADGESKCYDKKDDKLQISDASLESIHYCFYKGQLFSVIIRFSEAQNFQVIKDTLFQK